MKLHRSADGCYAGKAKMLLGTASKPPRGRTRHESHAVALTALLLAIIPFVLLSLFNHPHNDDYVYAARAQALGFLRANVWWYNFWSGRYTTTAILSINPLVFGSFLLYRFVAATIIGLLFCSLFLFIREVAPQALGTRARLILALTFLALYLYQMPAIAEGIYWMAGSVNYQLGCILLLGLTALLVHLERQPRPRTCQRALAIVLAVATAGTNELAMLLLVELSVVMLSVDLMENRRLDAWKVLVVLVSVLASAAVVLAPGTQARYHTVDHDVWSAMRTALVQGVAYLGNWVAWSPILPVTVLLMPLIAKIPRDPRAYRHHPLATLGFFMLNYFLLWFPPLYTTGTIEPRTVTVIYLVFLIGFIANLLNIANYCLVRCGWQMRLWTSVRTASGALIVVMCVAGDSNLRAAWSDLLSGSAYRYSRELDARYQAIRACPMSVCEVGRLRDMPRVMYFFDDPVDENSDSAFYREYKDHGYAAYFHKRRIKLTGDGHAP